MYYTSKDEPTWVAQIEVPGEYLYRMCENTSYKIKFIKDSTHGMKELIPASEKQIAHLKACIAADKYVEWNENMLTPQYEIY